MPGRHPRLPALPPEVWICIFDHATHVPDTLIPDVYAYASLFGTICTKSSSAAIRASLVTKRALVRVCKQWWHLAVPYLYRSVYIGRAHHLPSLLNSFVRSAAGDSLLAGTRPLGEHTERLDVAVRIRNHADDADTEFDLLSALFPCMPDLAIVAFACTPNYYTPSRDIVNSILGALQHSAASLRVLDWPLWTLSVSSSRTTDFLAQCIQLRFLNCFRLCWSEELRYGIPPTVTTIHLHNPIPIMSRILQIVDPSITRQTEPSALRELILDLHSDVSCCEDLLHVYSAQLVSVQFCVPNPNIDSFSVKDHMELLTQVCPSLSCLTLTADHFSSLTDPDLIFPSITRLALRITRPQLSKVEFETFLAFLEHVRSTVPSLQILQLLNARNVRCLVKAHAKLAVRTFLPFLEATGFRVEDHDGVLLRGSRIGCFGHAWTDWFRMSIRQAESAVR